MQTYILNSKPISPEHDLQCQENKRRYAKLTPELKQEFLRKIIFQNMTIKQASELLRINYSSAKAILSTHKKSNTYTPRKMTQKLVSRMASFNEIRESQRTNGISSMCCSVGGLLVNEHRFQTGKTKLISKDRKKEKRQTQDEQYQSYERKGIKADCVCS